jgi:hypothetical protein
MSDEPVPIYVCYEPSQRGHAERIDDWPRTNVELDRYDARVAAAPDAPEAARSRALVDGWIRAARVVVCLVSENAWRDAWVRWELAMAKQPDDRKGLVGVTIDSYAPYPREMIDSGAIFVRYNRDHVARAIRWAATGRYVREDFTLVDD